MTTKLTFISVPLTYVENAIRFLPGIGRCGELPIRDEKKHRAQEQQCRCRMYRCVTKREYRSCINNIQSKRAIYFGTARYSFCNQSEPECTKQNQEKTKNWKKLYRNPTRQVKNIFHSEIMGGGGVGVVVLICRRVSSRRPVTK